MFAFEGFHQTPGQIAAIETFENEFKWGNLAPMYHQGMVVSGAARDAGNSADTTILRPGLLLGLINSSQKLVQWSSTATDGSQYIYGVLMTSLKMQRNGSNQDRFSGPIMMGGGLKAARVLVPGQASVGLSGQALEYLIRAQLGNRFMFDDKPWPMSINGYAHVAAKTADYTVTTLDNNTLFTNKGAAGAVIFTLPATALLGLRYGFYVAADQSLTVTAGTADTLIVFNDAAADSVGFATAGDKVGGYLEVIGDGALWMVRPSTFADGVLVQTLTIAT